MNKKTLRIAGWALGLSMAVAGIGAAVGGLTSNPSFTEIKAASGSSYSFSTAASTSGTSTDSKWSFATDKSGGTTAPAYNAKTGELRIYSGNWFEISGAAGIEIISAEFTCKFNQGGSGSSKAYVTGWSVNNGTIDAFPTGEESTTSSFEITSINASSFRLSVSGEKGNIGLLSVVVNYSTATPATSITLSSSSSVTIGEGSTSQIVAQVDKDASDKRITYFSNDEDVATVNESGLITGVAEGTTTIDVKSYSTPAVKTSVSVTVTGRVFIPNAYNKVIKQSELVSGAKYLIVYEADSSSGYAFNGSDAAYGSVAVALGSTVIQPTAQIDYCCVDIATYSTGYSLYMNNLEKYIGGTSGSNTISYNGSALLNTISISDGVARITSNTSFIQFNNNADQLRFRYYKSGTTTQNDVSLYRYVGGDLSTESFATYFNNSTTSICSSGSTSDSHAEPLNSIWSYLSDKSNELSLSDKASLATAPALGGGTALQDALARYDHMMVRYKASGLTDFLGRFSEGGIHFGTFKTDSFNSSSGFNTNSVLVVTIVSVALLTTGGIFLISRRRREE